jgi:subtilisin family serine protease
LLTDSQALNHAVDKWNVDIISMSFGYQQVHPGIRRAIKHAYHKGKIMFAAASNEGVTNVGPSLPARMHEVICVNSAVGWGAPSRFNPPAKTNQDNFSVLGEGVLSAWPTTLSDKGHVIRRGTSIATPIAAGIAALLLELTSQRPCEIPEPQIKTMKEFDGMRKLFILMSSRDREIPAGGYNFVQPWDLVKKSKGVRLVNGEITYTMQTV